MTVIVPVPVKLQSLPPAKKLFGKEPELSGMVWLKSQVPLRPRVPRSVLTPTPGLRGKPAPLISARQEPRHRAGNLTVSHRISDDPVMSIGSLNLRLSVAAEMVRAQIVVLSPPWFTGPVKWLLFVHGPVGLGPHWTPSMGWPLAFPAWIQMSTV